MAQKGHIRINGRYWILKVREVVQVNGKRQRKDTYKKLGLLIDHRANPDGSAPKSIRALADLELAPINAGQNQGRSADTVKSYLESYIAQGLGSKTGRKLRSVTTASYQRDYNVIKPFISDMQLRQVRTPDINEWFNRLREADQDDPRSQSAYNNVKSFLSGAFRSAVGSGKIDFNPVQAARSIEGKDADTHAYTVHEIHALIQAMQDLPIVQRLLTVLYFTGIRPEEIRGLKYSDLDESRQVLEIRRTVVVNDVIEDTKTKASKSAIPVINIVKEALGRGNQDDYIFPDRKPSKPIKLGYLMRRKVIPTLDKAGIPYHGLHACRRGLSSAMHELQIPELTISHILRHSVKSLTVTGRHYIKPSLDRMRAALEKVEALYLELE